MRNIPRPNRDLTADFDLCVRPTRGAKRQALKARRLDTLAQYNIHAMAGGHPNLNLDSSTWSNEDKKWLRALYKETYQGGRLEDLRASAFSQAKNCCPLCSVGTLKTLDHHLPKVIQPALSINALNLVPACRDCNSSKEEAYSLNPTEQFVHAYLDVIPANVHFLNVAPFVGGTLSPNYSIVPNGVMNQDLVLRLQHQFSKLNLNLLYADLAIGLFGERRDHWLDIAISSSVPSLLASLVKEANAAIAERGINHWKPVFLSALATSPVFSQNTIAILQRQI